MLPNNYMLTAPVDIDETAGRSISSTDLLLKLKQINPSIQCPMPDKFGFWYPGKELDMTCLWIGPPSTAGSIKICAFRLGVIPEWTLLSKTGAIVTRGWRGIFHRVMRAGAAAQRQLEKAFGVDLAIAVDEIDGYCQKCRKAGKRVKADSVDENRKIYLCTMHQQVGKAVMQDKQFKEEVRYLLGKGRKNKWL